MKKQTDDRFQNGKELHERWMRLPTKGRCSVTGLTRGYFYLHLHDFKTAVLRRRGCTTGVRLVWLPSVLEYIEAHVEKVGGA